MTAINIDKWFPIHLHVLPKSLDDFMITGAVVSVEWNLSLLKKYYNWTGTWPKASGERILAFFRHWKQLSKESVLGHCHNILFSIEGESDLGNLTLLPKMKENGLVAFQLFHWLPNKYYDPSHGLTKMGLKLLRVLEDCDIYLDMSHLKGHGLIQVLEKFAGKKIVSHVVCEELLDWSLVRRSNAMSAQELVLCDADIYGVPFIDDLISPNACFTSAQRKVQIKNVAQHILVLAGIVGHHRVSLGPDYFDYQIVYERLGVEVNVISDLDTPLGLEKLSNSLIKLGYSTQQIENIFWRNAERILLGIEDG
jgi:membrane dipeptidase